MKYLILIFALFLIPLTSQAASTMTINFNYSNSTLGFGNPVTNQDKNAYISIFDFGSQAEQSTGPYALKLIDVYNHELVTLHFNAQAGNFSLTVPYFSTIQKMQVFENNNQTPILEQDLSSVNTCNANGVCEFEKGESGAGCIIDCGITNPTYSAQTKALLNKNNGVIKDETGKVVLTEVKQSSAVTWGIITAIALVTAGGVFLYIRHRRYER